MKKKGLIISTIVMMLVVVVAISTATYAWFAVSADAKISTLTVQTAASDGLQIASLYNTNGTTGNEIENGNMTLDPADLFWKGDVEGVGAELLFTDALSSAYGVTGNGQKSTMYTAASRNVLAYATTRTTGAWWEGILAAYNGANEPEDALVAGVDDEAIVGLFTSYVFYSNPEGTTIAVNGTLFQGGMWAGATTAAKLTITGATDGEGTGSYYIRKQGIKMLKVTQDNAGQFIATGNKFFNNVVATGMVEYAGAGFADGAWNLAGSGTAVDLWAAVSAVTGGVYAELKDSTLVTTANVGTYFNGTATPTDDTLRTVFYEDAELTTPANGTNFDEEGKYAVGGVANFGHNYIGGTEPAAATQGIVGLFVERTVHGDVEIDWSYEANNAAINTVEGSNIPRYLIPATANREYFQLNFVLQAQRGMLANAGTGITNVADIFIKKLTVTASGGMAAAARIALIGYGGNTNDTPDVAVARFAGDGVLLEYFVPFATSKANTTPPTATWNIEGTEEARNYMVAPASKWFQGTGFEYKYATQEVLANDITHFEINNNLIYNTAWNTATFYDIDKTTDYANATMFNTANAAPDAGTEDDNYNTKKMNSVGTFTAANSCRYYQLVIWFEGTDAECVTKFAGTGVTVDIAFDFFQRYQEVPENAVYPSYVYNTASNAMTVV